jgi:hypothetical protein
MVLSYVGAAVALWIAFNILFVLAISPDTQRSSGEI